MVTAVKIFIAGVVSRIRDVLGSEHAGFLKTLSRLQMNIDLDSQLSMNGLSCHRSNLGGGSLSSRSLLLLSGRFGV